MKFRYIGEEATEWFGFKWFPGTEHEVTDAHAISKLKNSILFEAAGEPVKAPVVAASAQVLEDLQPPVEVPQMPRRRGPNKPKPEAQ